MEWERGGEGRGERMRDVLWAGNFSVSCVGSKQKGALLLSFSHSPLARTRSSLPTTATTYISEMADVEENDPTTAQEATDASSFDPPPTPAFFLTAEQVATGTF